MMRRKIVSVDFDGTLHSYRSGWQGSSLVADLPVPGAIDFLRAAAKRFDVQIFSSRNRDKDGVAAMTDWLEFHGLSRNWIGDNLNFPTDKPPAHVTIDDRTMQFTGLFPSLDEIDRFQPWTRLTTSNEVVVDMPEARRPQLELLMMMATRRYTQDEQASAIGNAAAIVIIADSMNRGVSRLELLDRFCTRLRQVVVT